MVFDYNCRNVSSPVYYKIARLVHVPAANVKHGSL